MYMTFALSRERPCEMYECSRYKIHLNCKMHLVIKFRDLLFRTGCLQSTGFDNFSSKVIHFALKIDKDPYKIVKGRRF